LFDDSLKRLRLPFIPKPRACEKAHALYKAVMGNIIELSQHVANQIAAGEVVERPASVVKELVENALDAGATAIEVRIKDGGLAHIVVQDNGVGMDESDLALSIKRFATSKLKGPDELFSLTSFGFRGEALPSIASISRLNIISRQKNAEYGSLIKTEGGVLLEKSKAGALSGTRLEVRELFYNVPARLKFMRSKRSESSHIERLLRAFAFINPHLALKFFSDDRLIFSLEGDAQKTRALSLLGHDCDGMLYPFERDSGYVRLSGFFGAPLIIRRDSRSIFTFVNQRLVNDRKLLGAIKSGFRSLLAVGQQPVLALHLCIPSEEVDVNVHPRKDEVRFLDERRVHGHIISVLGEILSQTPWLKHEEALPKSVHAYALREKSPERDFAPLTPIQSFSFKPKSAEIYQHKLLAARRFSDLHFIGQARNTYLIFESEEGLVVVDQHAAHERVIFEKMRKKLDQSLASSPLLFPLSIKLSARELELALDCSERLFDFGFDGEPFGEDNFILRALPDTAKNCNAEALFRDLLSELDNLGRSNSMDDIFDRLCASIACHSAIRAGQNLAKEEISLLLEEMDVVDYSAHCPHGRPVVKSLPLAEMKKWFDRH
jgi:DNA mismatch repair protein MutL